MSAPRRAPGRRRRSPGALLAMVLCAVAMGVASEAAVAQTTQQVLSQRRLEYRAARSAHESALNRLRVEEQQFYSALAEVTRARRASDNAALDRANALALDRSRPYAEQEERVTETRNRLTVAREELIEIVQIRLEQLISEMDAASSAQRRAELNTTWIDLQNELQALEDESGEGFRLEPVVMPEITWDPRDGAAELGFKAQLLERRAAVTDTTIQDVDAEIRKLTDRLRMQRQIRDLEANIDRFDDTRLPVVTGQPPERPAVADSTGVGSVPLTIEERLRLLRDYRQQLFEYREQILIRARTFRESIRQVAA